MTRDEVLRIAIEHGLLLANPFAMQKMEKFANAIERATLERSAKVCEQIKAMNPHMTGCEWCAAEIRALI